MVKRTPPPSGRSRTPRRGGASKSRSGAGRPARSVEPGDLPPVAVADVVLRDGDGELHVRLVKFEDGPAFRLAPSVEEVRAGAPALGDRLLVRLETLESGEVQARLIKRLGQSSHHVLGVVRKGRGETRIEPVDRRSKHDFSLIETDAAPVRDGDLVLVQPLAAATRRYGPKPGRLLEVIGREDHPRAASLIAIHTHSIPVGFSPEAEAEADAAEPPTLGGREDLRALPLVTIDPEDARDHDDAVFAEPDPAPENPEGWIVWVAIADVAAYVRPGSALDREAWTKANSVYFPDRVEPMLPERLSAGLCSLGEGEARAVLAVRMVFDPKGRKRSHRFVRGLMRSAASLSYGQAQAAIDGAGAGAAATLLDPVLKPLWGAYRALCAARLTRSPLDIDSPERRVELNADGEVTAIARRERLDAHRLIEEMMIQANVCAAETLEQRKSPLIYRVHDAPSDEKIRSLSDFLSTVGLSWSKGEAPRTERFNRLLNDARAGAHSDIVNDVVLRTQMQAQYSRDNIGHFGLNLDRYAHFTSPIRRYADLVVHRALIRALKLGDGGLTDQEIARLEATADHITAAERAAMAAERDATDRYVAAFLEDRIGAAFQGRITGVTRFGLFIRLDDTGADGLVPISSLGAEYFVHDERSHALVGETSGRRWRLGRPVEVRLKEAVPVTGGLLFEMMSDPEPRDPLAARPRQGVRRRSPEIRPKRSASGSR